MSPSLRCPAVPSGPIGAADALASLATSLHATERLYVGGAAQRAARLAEAGAFIEDAAFAAAVQGKGHVAELAQAASFSARSGALGRDAVATLSKSASDPVADLRVTSGGRIRKRVQVKVGQPRYVLRAARSRRYPHIVANTEAKRALEELGFEEAFHIADHLYLDGHRAETLSAHDAQRRAIVALERDLDEALPFGARDILSEMGRASVKEGATTFAMALTLGVVERVWSGVRFDLPSLAREALGAAARGAVRAGVQTGALALKFVAEAKSAFAARVLHRVAKSAHVVGAIAEVVVETSLDFLAVLRDRLTFEDFLRRVGVHTFTAAGGALGLWLAAEVTRGEPWWVQLLAMGIGGWGGSTLGRSAGVALFIPDEAPALLPIAATR